MQANISQLHPPYIDTSIMDYSQYSTKAPIALVIKKHNVKVRNAVLNQRFKLEKSEDKATRLVINDESVCKFHLVPVSLMY